MDSGTTITLSPWCFLTLMHPHAHLPPLPHHQSDKWHAEPSVDTGAQCDSRAHPTPHPSILHHPRDLIAFLLLPSDAAPLTATGSDARETGVEWEGKQ